MERQQSRRTMWLATAFLDYQEACRSRTTYGRSCGIRSVITSSSRVTECMLSSTRISSSCEWASQGTSENRTLEFMHAWIRERFSEETTHTKRMRNTTKIWRNNSDVSKLCAVNVHTEKICKYSIDVGSVENTAHRAFIEQRTFPSGDKNILHANENQWILSLLVLTRTSEFRWPGDSRLSNKNCSSIQLELNCQKEPG